MVTKSLLDSWGFFAVQYWGNRALEYFSFDDGTWNAHGIIHDDTHELGEVWPEAGMAIGQEVWGIEAYENGGSLYIFHSDDGGDTWGKEDVGSPPNDNIVGLYPISLDKWVGFFVDTDDSTYDLYASVSEDRGQTWGTPTLLIATTVDYRNQFAVCSDEDAGTFYVAGGLVSGEIVCRRSDDGSETWTDPVTIASEVSIFGPIYMTAHGGHVFIADARTPWRVWYSHDNGATWGNVVIPNLYGDNSYGLGGIGVCDTHLVVLAAGTDYTVYPSRYPVYRFVATDWDGEGEPTFVLDATYRELPEYEHYNSDPDYDCFPMHYMFHVPEHLPASDEKMFVVSYDVQINRLSGGEIVEITYEYPIYAFPDTGGPVLLAVQTDPDADVYDLLARVQYWGISAVYTHGVAMPDYEGDARGVPLAGDRSAWEVDGYPERHASDLNDGEPRHHNPWPMASGEAAVSDGNKLVPTDVATQAELDAHEGAANPHGTTIDDLDDVSAATPDDEDALLWNAGASQWQPNSVLTHVWEPLTNGDASSPELIYAGGDVIMVEMED